MPRPRRPWSKVIEEAGVAVRLYEREPGSLIYREVRSDGQKDRRSLGHRDRRLAEDQARALAKRLAELRFAGQTSSLTVGQLCALYLQHQAPELSAERQRAVRGFVALLERGFGRHLAVEDIGEHHVQRYVRQRKDGTLVSPRHRGEAGVRSGTVRNELRHLSTMCRWARGFRVGGRRLLVVDPMDGIAIPSEQNTRRPLMTQERYDKLLKVADAVDPAGRFRLVLVLARTTGRRINAIIHLRGSDVLRTRRQMEEALSTTGQPIAAAAAWTFGAVRWRGEWDKKGYDSVAPLSEVARVALDAYLAAHPTVGEAPLIPATNDPSVSAHKMLALYWLRRAEKLAALPRLEQGGYHPFRRWWASERRHLPVQDVMAAGGWRSAQVMQTAYQHADAATMLSVVNAPSGHTRDTTRKKRAASQRVTSR